MLDSAFPSATIKDVFTLHLPAWLLPSPSLPAHLRTGIQGEKIAERYLRHSGYRILGKNIRIDHDEIDLLAFDPRDRVLVFAEVKARAENHADFQPELNMTDRKRTAISRIARRWIHRHAYDGGYRLDLLSVADGRVIEHMKEITWST